MARGWSSLAVGLAFCLFSYAGAQEGDCAASDNQARALEQQLAQVQAEAAAAKAEASQLRQELALAKGVHEECAAGQEHSVLGVASTYGSIAGDALQHLLDQTTFDERAYQHASATHVMVRDALGMVSSMDIKEVMDKVYKHELYITNIAPVIDTVSLQTQPYIDQYMTPLLEQAKPHVEAIKTHVEAIKTTAQPAMAAAQDTFAKVTEQHIPAARDAGTKAIGSVPGLVVAAEETIASLLAPVFSFVEKVSPKRKTILPKSTTDRVLLLIFTIFAALYSFYVVKFSLRITFKVTWFSLRKALWISVKLPLKLLGLIIGWTVYIGTCFGCCCLFRRKTSETENGKADSKKATVAEIVTLLQRAKDKNKLEAAVKVFHGVAGKGTTMDAKKFGDVVDGKTLDKDVLKKAAGSFKELDLKKLGL